MDNASEDKIQEFVRLVKEKCVSFRKPCAIFTHKPFDPDGLGAGLGLKLIIKRLGGRAVMFYGEPSHPQNKTIVDRFKINLAETADFKPDNFGLVIFVDVSRQDKRTPDGLEPDIIFDHHTEKQANGSFSDIRPLGSTSTIILEYLRKLVPDFNPEDEEFLRAANAIYWGIRTDTHNWADKDVTKNDIDAFVFLQPFLNHDALWKIENYDYPEYFFEFNTIAEKEKEIKDGLLVAGLGFISTKRAGGMSFVADFVLRRPSVETAVVFAVVGNEFLQVSVRTDKSNFEITHFLQRVFGVQSSGLQQVGHSSGATIPLPAVSIFTPEENASAEEKEAFWRLLSMRVKRLCYEAYIE